MIPRIVGTLAAVVLIGLGTLHGYWAAGGRWATDVTIPKREGEPLFTPGPAGILLVALLLYAAALVLFGRLGLWGHWLPRWVFVAGTWTLVGVFGARVVGDFRWFGLFKQMTGTPFAWWDTWLYVPLCALLALAALLVASLEPGPGVQILTPASAVINGHKGFHVERLRAGPASAVGAP